MKITTPREDFATAAVLASQPDSFDAAGNKTDWRYDTDVIQQLEEIHAAALARWDERERCAKVVEDALNHYQDESCTLTMTVALHCIAADIRSGKRKPC